MEGSINQNGIAGKYFPSHWEWVKLGDICEVVTGTTPSKSDIKNYGDEIPFFKPPHLWDQQIFETEEMLSSQGAKKSRIVPPKTVLVTCIGNLGRTGFVKKKAAFNQQINAILENESIDGKYIFYQAQSPLFKKQLEQLATGTTVSIVNKGNFETIRIPLPPREEQFLIVSKIEELFSELDKGKQQLATAQQQLKVYRQAVLKWAFEGKLTNKSVKEGELPEGWRMIELGKICDKIQDGSHFSPQVQYTEPAKNRYMYITAKNIRNNYMDMTKLIYVDKDFHDSIYNRCNPEFGDVLLTKDGVNTGEVTLNTIHEPFSLLSSVCLFKTKQQELKGEYLKYFIQSPFGSKLIDGSMTGTAIKRIVLRKIRSSEIILPSIDEQNILVLEIESRLSVCDKLEETINQSLDHVETLRQSILKRAFEGKLVGQAETENIRALKIELPTALRMVAEPEVQYKKSDRQVQFPKVIEGIATTDLHAGILALVIDSHEQSSQHHVKLSHVKGEKIAHLIEAHIGIELGRVPRKDAAGPDDFPHLKKVESRALKAGWFGVKKLRVGQTYISKRGMPKIITKLTEKLSADDLMKIQNLIKTFLPFDLEHAEVIATLYAGWNNLLLEGKTPTDEEIVYESRENWSKRKLGIEREVFFKALKWMREHNLVPSGKGKKVMAVNR